MPACWTKAYDHFGNDHGEHKLEYHHPQLILTIQLDLFQDRWTGTSPDKHKEVWAPESFKT